MLFKISDIYICKLSGEIIESKIILKNTTDEIGVIWINIRDAYGTFHQISTIGTIRSTTGGNVMSFEGLGKGNPFFESPINSITGKIVYYGGNYSDFRSCREGSFDIKSLPEAYTQKESTIIVGVGVIILLSFYIILRKYIFIFGKKSKHKK